MLNCLSHDDVGDIKPPDAYSTTIDPTRNTETRAGELITDKNVVLKTTLLKDTHTYTHTLAQIHAKSPAKTRSLPSRESVTFWQLAQRL